MTKMIYVQESRKDSGEKPRGHDDATRQWHTAGYYTASVATVVMYESGDEYCHDCQAVAKRTGIPSAFVRVVHNKQRSIREEISSNEVNEHEK